MSETLYAKDIGHSMTATDKFSRDPGLMLARPARGCMPCIMIPHGFHALVTYNGAEIEKNGSYVWGSGCKCASCLTGISHLVTKQYVVFDVVWIGEGPYYDHDLHHTPGPVASYYSGFIHSA